MSNEELVAGIQESREMLTSLRASEAARKPALIHWRNRKPRLVTMRLVDWLKLYRTESKQRENPPPKRKTQPPADGQKLRTVLRNEAPPASMGRGMPQKLTRRHISTRWRINSNDQPRMIIQEVGANVKRGIGGEDSSRFYGAVRRSVGAGGGVNQVEG